MSRIRLTTNPDIIQQWAHERDGKPASIVDSDGDKTDLVIEFPDFRSSGNLKRIQWRSFHSEFDSRKLAFLYKEQSYDGKPSCYYKLIPAPEGVLQRLYQEHEKVFDIFEKLEDTTHQATKTRRDGVQQLNKLLKPHLKAEEKLLYKALKKGCEKTEQKVDVLEGYEEHKLAKKTLKRLFKTKPESSKWKARFSVLKELIEHHVQEEESELFEIASDILQQEELEKMLQPYQMKSEKVLSKIS